MRLRAIYALEKPSKTKPEYYQPIIDILCSYVRQHAQIPQITKQSNFDRIRVDEQTVMTVIGSRTVLEDELWLNLAYVYLPNNNLLFAKLQGAHLMGADLNRANINGASLTSAIGLTKEQLMQATNWEGIKYDL